MLFEILAVLIFIVCIIMNVSVLMKINKLNTDLQNIDESNISLFKKIEKDLDNIKYYLNNTRTISSFNDNLIKSRVEKNSTDIKKKKDK